MCMELAGIAARLHVLESTPLSAARLCRAVCLLGRGTHQLPSLGRRGRGSACDLATSARLVVLGVVARAIGLDVVRRALILGVVGHAGFLARPQRAMVLNARSEALRPCEAERYRRKQSALWQNKRRGNRAAQCRQLIDCSARGRLSRSKLGAVLAPASAAWILRPPRASRGTSVPTC